MLKLIDNRAESSLEIDGTKVVVRQLLLPEKQALSWVLSKYRDGDNLSVSTIPLDELIPVLAPAFVKAEGLEYENAVDFLYRLPSQAHIWKIAIHVLQNSGLSESESKNSESSSERSPEATAGTATKNVKRGKKRVSRAIKK